MTESLEKLRELTNALAGKLVAEEAALRTLSEIINDGFFDWNLDTDYEYMSPKFWEILGYDHTTKRHHPNEWQRLIDPDDAQAWLEDFNEHVRTKGASGDICRVVRYICGGCGRWKRIICRGAVTTWRGDEPVRLIGTHTLIPGSCACG